MNNEIEEGSEVSSEYYIPNTVHTRICDPLYLQLFRSNSYVWNFMRPNSRKHSSKPFVVFKTWDTNDRSVNARQIYKIGKVTKWDDKDRVTILIYQLLEECNSDWYSALPSKSSIRWIPISETRMLNTRVQDSQLQVHKDWISLLIHWNNAITLTVRIASNLGNNDNVQEQGASVLLPSINLSACLTNQDRWIDRWVSNSALNNKLKDIAKAVALERI